MLVCVSDKERVEGGRGRETWWKAPGVSPGAGQKFQAPYLAHAPQPPAPLLVRRGAGEEGHWVGRHLGVT